MGGYGALRWALRDPGRFAAAASLSGALDIEARQSNHEWRSALPGLFEQVFGDGPMAGSDDDLFALLERADPASLPALFIACGTEDALYPESERFVEACRSRGVSPTVHIGPGGPRLVLLGHPDPRGPRLAPALTVLA